MVKTRWIGLIPAAKRILYGAASKPKAIRLGETSTLTTSEYYSGMNEDYRWFRQDELIRKCLATNAFFATLTEGFETVLEATSKDIDAGDYEYVKESVDEANRKVNLDQALFVAQVKRSIYGKAGFEIVLDNEGNPSWLLSLQSTRLKPRINNSWELESYQYEGRTDFYSPDEVLYFTNLGIEADYEGLSDIEPVRSVCQARHELLREDFPEIARTLWAPYVVLEADTSGISQEEAEKVVEELGVSARAGKSIAVNESVKATVVDLTPNVEGLSKLLDHLERAIIGNFGTPRFLLGRPIENRATAYAELEAYVNGTIASIQRYLKREIESQWYDRWTLKALNDEGERIPEGGDPPIRVKHRWKPIRVTDVYEMAKAVSTLWGIGSGPIQDNYRKAWDLMGWNPAELEVSED